MMMLALVVHGGGGGGRGYVVTRLEREGGREEGGERFHCCVEETVYVAARCAVRVHVRRREPIWTVDPRPRRSTRMGARVWALRHAVPVWARRAGLHARRRLARSPAGGSAEGGCFDVVVVVVVVVISMRLDGRRRV